MYSSASSGERNCSMVIIRRKRLTVSLWREYSNICRTFSNSASSVISVNTGISWAASCTKQEDTRKRIIEKALELFSTRGYDAVSEKALKPCLTSRYPRDRYILTDKLTNFYFKKEEDIRPLFESQLEACGVDYFDFYLMHAQSAEIFKHFKSCRAYETAFQLKEEGLVKHVGISFHDSAAFLEEIP